MSVLAKTLKQVKSDNQHASLGGKVDSNKSSAQISVSARIDYIQRFSKQMSIVVADDPRSYSQLAKQYLTNISQQSSVQDVNVAFVSSSNKLNDIQMRCRLIEQLFANTLFDPEQSLAVSLLRLCKQQREVVTIVIDHAHSLSLQLKYELCQLAELAKKTENNINVVLFGTEETAKEISQNKSLFHKKVSIIDANNGQVIPIEHHRFKKNTAFYQHKHFNKLVGYVTGIILLIGLSLYLIMQYNDINVKNVLETLTFQETKKPPANKIIENSNISVGAVKEKHNIASVRDVYTTLTNIHREKVGTLKPANSTDVLVALTLSEQSTPAQVASKNLQSNSSEASKDDIKVVTQSNNPVNLTHKNKVEKNANLYANSINKAYYTEASSGYVVQIAGFTTLPELNRFVSKNKNITYFGYQKLLNGKDFLVITSKIFAKKQQAQSMLKSLPDAIQQRGSFIKSITTIKREINSVND